MPHAEERVQWVRVMMKKMKWWEISAKDYTLFSASTNRESSSPRTWPGAAEEENCHLCCMLPPFAEPYGFPIVVLWCWNSRDRHGARGGRSLMDSPPTPTCRAHKYNSLYPQILSAPEVLKQQMNDPPTPWASSGVVFTDYIMGGCVKAGCLRTALWNLKASKW